MQDFSIVCIGNRHYLGFGGPWVCAVSAIVCIYNVLVNKNILYFFVFLALPLMALQRFWRKIKLTFINFLLVGRISLENFQLSSPNNLGVWSSQTFWKTVNPLICESLTQLF